MLGRTYDHEACSAARALEIAGERWSLLILRNAFFAGVSRFTDFQRSLRIAPNILTKRLADFVQAGLMTTQKGDTEHLEYVLTDKGLDFKPVVVALTAWGDKWAAPIGPPIAYKHAACGGIIQQRLRCERCGEDTAHVQVLAEKTPAMALYQAKIRKKRKR